VCIIQDYVKFRFFRTLKNINKNIKGIHPKPNKKILFIQNISRNTII